MEGIQDVGSSSGLRFTLIASDARNSLWFFDVQSYDLTYTLIPKQGNVQAGCMVPFSG